MVLIGIVWADIQDDNPNIRVEKQLLKVLSFEEAAFGDDLDELEQGYLPEYLRKLEFYCR